MDPPMLGWIKDWDMYEQ